MKKSQLNKLKKYKKQLTLLNDDLSELSRQMQEDFESKTEHWQDSEKGKKLLSQITILDNILTFLYDTEEEMEELTDIENE